MTHEQRIAAHRERVQAELANEPEEPVHKPFIGFNRMRRGKKKSRPYESSLSTSGVLLARLVRLQLMLSNPGYSIHG